MKKDEAWKRQRGSQRDTRTKPCKKKPKDERARRNGRIKTQEEQEIKITTWNSRQGGNQNEKQTGTQEVNQVVRYQSSTATGERGKWAQERITLQIRQDHIRGRDPGDENPGDQHRGNSQGCQFRFGWGGLAPPPHRGRT